MTGNNTINAQQIIVNVSDTIPPENLATIDKGSLVGNAVSKEQFQNQFDAMSDEIDEKFEELKDQVESNFKGVLKPTDAAPTEDGSYKPAVSSEDDKPTDPNSTADWGKVYANAGNLRAKTGYDTMFYKKGAVWTKAETKMPMITAEKVFNPADNVNPAAMKATYDASKTLVNKGFEGEIISTEILGWDTNGASTTNQTTNSTYIIANNKFAVKSGVIKNITANFTTGGSVTAVIFAIENNQIAIKSQHVFTVVDGVNSLPVNIPILAGQSLGWLRTISLKIKFTDGISGRSYISNIQNPPSINTYTGYVAYTINVESTSIDSSFTIDTIKEKLTQSEKSITKRRSFSHELDFGVNLEQRYTKIFGNVILSAKNLDLSGVFNYLKLTGGSLQFDSNFKAQENSASYIPSKTNTIFTYSEYGKVRYFIENTDFEPLTFTNKTVTYQDFTNKGANTELAAINADYGVNFLGKTSDFKINSGGGWLESKVNDPNFSSAIFINKSNFKNYKVTLFLAFNEHVLFAPNDPTGSTFSDYIRVMKATPNTTIRHASPLGNFDTTTTLVPATSASGYLWEIEVKGESVKIFINSGLAYSGTTTLNGDYFSLLFSKSGNIINSINIEEL